MKDNQIADEELVTNLLVQQEQVPERTWTYQELWVECGHSQPYPRKGSASHFLWREERSKRITHCNKILKNCKLPQRFYVKTLKNNGTAGENVWSVVPKREVPAWLALSGYNQMLSAVFNTVERAEGFAGSKGITPKQRAAAEHLAAALRIDGQVLLEEAANHDGIAKAKIKKLEEWKNRLDRLNQKRLEAGEEESQGK